MRAGMLGEPSLRRVHSVLVADDDEMLLSVARRSLARDHAVFTANTTDGAHTIVERERPDLAIIDLRFGTASGLDLVRELKAVAPSMFVTLYSAYLSVSTTVLAMRAGAELVVFKPITFKDIVRRVLEERLDHGPANDEETPTLARVEWEHISRVLTDCDGNVSEAARRLGIYRSSLQRRLRKPPPAE